jgi:hypothetical protein
MLVIVDAYNSHLHHWHGLTHTAIRLHPLPCQAGRRLQPFLLIVVALVLTLPVLAVLARGCNGTLPAPQILGEMARTVLPGYAWTSRWGCA